MSNFDDLIRTMQSICSHNSWEITKEQAFRSFYKEKGRVKEARLSREVLKRLHQDQVQNKNVLRSLRRWAMEDRNG